MHAWACNHTASCARRPDESQAPDTAQLPFPLWPHMPGASQSLPQGAAAPWPPAVHAYTATAPMSLPMPASDFSGRAGTATGSIITGSSLTAMGAASSGGVEDAAAQLSDYRSAYAAMKEQMSIKLRHELEHKQFLQVGSRRRHRRHCCCCWYKQIAPACMQLLSVALLFHMPGTVAAAASTI